MEKQLDLFKWSMTKNRKGVSFEFPNFYDKIVYPKTSDFFDSKALYFGMPLKKTLDESLK